ncbi:hypothetical protein J6590_046648 [Homalodisca vitripennis]|nr:hypothetical protein J6590_046648 [Homalodisca vitripennis]
MTVVVNDESKHSTFSRINIVICFIPCGGPTVICFIRADPVRRTHWTGISSRKIFTLSVQDPMFKGLRI